MEFDESGGEKLADEVSIGYNQLRSGANKRKAKWSVLSGHGLPVTS
jgi:hypothetical protein